MNREEKRDEVTVITEKLMKSQIALIADYRGLSVADMTKLRKKLREGSAGGRVVKNTLARLAARKALGADDQGAEIEKFLAELKGPTFLVYSDKDPVQPAKIIQDFAKEKDLLKVRGAWVDGTFVNTKGVEALSKMPGKEEVLATLLRLLNTPAEQLVRVLSAPARGVVQVVDAARRKLEGN